MDCAIWFEIMSIFKSHIKRGSWPREGVMFRSLTRHSKLAKLNTSNDIQIPYPTKVS